MSAKEILPDQPPPESARCVGDLVAWVKDNQEVTFTATQALRDKESPFFKVATMGGFMNNDLPRFKPRVVENRPTPKRRNLPYRPLTTLGDVEVEFDGDPEWMADLYT